MVDMHMHAANAHPSYWLSLRISYGWPTPNLNWGPQACPTFACPSNETYHHLANPLPLPVNVLRCLIHTPGRHVNCEMTFVSE